MPGSRKGNETPLLPSSAGDDGDRKKGSGCIVFLNGSTVKTSSTVQSIITLSLGEAEYYALTKGAAVGISIRALLEDFGEGNVALSLRADSTTAKSLGHRLGAGRIKHLEVRQLWCQAMVEKYCVEVLKIPRKLNLADVVPRRCMNLFHDAVNVYLTAEP